MMYEDEKVRHMIRSILPSKARKQAKQSKDALHRHNRRIVNQQLGGLHCEDDWYDCEEDLTLWEEPHQGYWDKGFYGLDIVYSRRAHDKLAHFERWAYHKTLDVRDEDKYSAIVAIFKGGPLGYHASTHLYFLKWDPLRPDEPLVRYEDRKNVFTQLSGNYLIKRKMCNILIERGLIDELNKLSYVDWQGKTRNIAPYEGDGHRFCQKGYYPDTQHCSGNS